MGQKFNRHRDSIERGAQSRPSEVEAVVEPEVLDEKDKHEPRTNNVRRVLSAERYIGPIPPAEEFAKYGQVMPTAPERILTVFEKDSDHTRNMQAIALRGEISRDCRSQWMAFFSILCSIGLTAFALAIGQDVAAALAGLASLFLVFKGAFSKSVSSVEEKEDTPKIENKV
ncbi:DUF2335 domain-containing protein [Sporomusa sphaeroides]|uniref:DUF2335 domain-containing protein n=1 Tax=Sporomusa sphaeroides DSM 2875 TaxID=1337886 RepID=A0ABM9W5I4_9FIRM|nr:DUF2335 domain-containing protein [Sporomusa sphaeroides]OLS56152.1 hypothetical protein SPSPH_25410 [Sporomusa sphaeroides DSM 2875]CVK19206.1 hypothetical protein SSPH_01855 [Sporomusa sphaeroides DSM 2875]